MYKSANAKKLSELNLVAPATPSLIKRIWSADNAYDILRMLPYQTATKLDAWVNHLYNKPALRETKMRAISILTQFNHCGLEHLGFDEKGREIDYLNMCDTYAQTIVFYGNRLLVCSWGDIVENQKIYDAYKGSGDGFPLISVGL